MKPILFNTDMVKAILEGRKTMTRRIANINTEISCGDGTKDHEFVLDNFNPVHEPTGFVCRRCGFGVAPRHSRIPVGTSFFRPRYWPGDILYVRETWRIQAAHRFEADVRIEFKARGQKVTIQFPGRCSDSHERESYDDFVSHWWSNGKWHPSIFMPKEAARIFLKVKSVRVERLHDLTNEDALKEGCIGIPCDCSNRDEHGCVDCLNTGWIEPPAIGFIELWDSTINKADLPTCGFDANPWVWVIEFERCEKPQEDSL